MVILCDAENCKYNEGRICHRPTILTLRSGRCQIPYDVYGQVRPAEDWVKTEEDKSSEELET